MQTAYTRHQQFLAQLFDKDDYINAESSPEAAHIFATDASRVTGRDSALLAVVRPRTTEQLAELLRYAQEERIPIHPRAAATNVVGGCLPGVEPFVPCVPHTAAPEQTATQNISAATMPALFPAGIVVSMLHFNKILNISADDFTVQAEPCVVTGSLQKAVERQGLFYPPDPASLAMSTIGGNVSTCAGGMRAVKYGVTRDYVLGLSAVLAGGKILHCGGRCHKNVVGLDIARLFCGSEGTLGIITELTMKLLPLPEASATVLAGFNSMQEAISALAAVFRAGILPATMEFLGTQTLHCLALLESRHHLRWNNNVRAALIIRLDGGQKALIAEKARLSTVLSGSSVWQLEADTPAEEEALWELRRSINPASFLIAPHKMSDDITVPRGALHAALTRIDDIAAKHRLHILTFGHAGDGNIHVNIMHNATDKAELSRARTAKLEMMHSVLALGGTMSGEHGIGAVRMPFINEQLSSLERTLMQGIKKSFDPYGIMNPNKAY